MKNNLPIIFQKYGKFCTFHLAQTPYLWRVIMPVLHILLPFPRPLRSPTSHMYVLIISHYILQKKKVCAWWNNSHKKSNEMNNVYVFSYIPKVWQILKVFVGTFHQAYFWRVNFCHFIKKKDIIIEISFNMIFQFMSFLSTLSLLRPGQNCEL